MTKETILEKKGVYAPWEDDLPSTCRHCDGSKYIISILYEAKKSRERIAELERQIEEFRSAAREYVRIGGKKLEGTLGRLLPCEKSTSSNR